MHPFIIYFVEVIFTIRGKIKKRIDQMFLACIIIFTFILGKLVYEQTINHNNILEKAKALWERDFTITANRGRILDKNGVVLAQDIPSTSLMVVPSQIKNPKAMAKRLANILKSDENRIYEIISKKASTQKLQPMGRLLSEDKIKAIEAMRQPGIYLVKDSLRNYPNHAYLAQVLGFTGIDNQGLAGLELQYDKILAAKNGALGIPFDAKGHHVNLYHERYVAGGKGMDIELTIDAYMQDVIEREMNNLMKRYKPKQALALAMNPQTGEILSIVSKPDFDPNHYQEYPSAIYNRNLPIWMSFEPGSTFKSITFAAGLQTKSFDMLKDTYFDKGYEMVGGRRIKSWKAGGHGLQTFLEVLENSSNPGFVEISRRLGLDHLYNYVKNFGFGTKTGVDMPGESSGIVFKKKAMGEVEQATVAFGQGLSVTPIQLVTAFSAVVNGGTLFKPYITNKIVNPINKDPIVEYLPTKIRQVISKETSDKMKYALECVVAHGGGKNAYMKGYQIGGKTGTAQKAVDGAYLANEYILSFLSAAPINDPQIVLYIAVDSPQNDVQYGGTVVAPVVKACYEDILPYLKVKKVKSQIAKKTTWLDPIEYKLANYVGLEKEKVKDEALTFEFIGEGTHVLAQLPSEGTFMQAGGKVWIYLGEDKVK
ncbi:MAG: penicillin-binding transpeptidase domain-containing protein [Erysipelotrichaceae bacterium]